MFQKSLGSLCPCASDSRLEGRHSYAVSWTEEHMAFQELEVIT